MPAKEIATQLGRTLQSVKSKAQEIEASLVLYGEAHHSSSYSNSIVEQCRRMNDEGINVAQIACKMGLDLKLVADWVSFRTRCYDPVPRCTA